MIWDTLIWRLGCSNRWKIPSAQKCYPCLRYVVYPMSPGWTQTEWRRGWDSNPRDPFGPNGFQDRRSQPLSYPSVFSAAPVIVTYAAFDDNQCAAANVAMFTEAPASIRATEGVNSRAIPSVVRAAGMIRFNCKNSLSLAARAIRQSARGGSCNVSSSTDTGCRLRSCVGCVWRKFSACAEFLHAGFSSCTESGREIPESPRAGLPRRAAQRSSPEHTRSRAICRRANSQHLHAGGQSETGSLSGAMLLRLRQRSVAEEPAGLFY